MRSTRFPLLAGAEVTLTLVTVAAVLSLGRLFDDGSWRRPLVAAAIAAHLAAAVLRRLRIPLVLIAVLHLGLGLLVLGWIHARDTTRSLLPTRETFDVLQAETSDSVEMFRDAIAPTDPATGYLILATIAIWVLVLLADLAAFWVRSAFEAVVPSVSIVVFVSVFGVAEDRWSLLTLYLLAIVAFVSMHRVSQQLVSAVWLGRQGRATAALLRGAAGVTAVAAVLGLGLAPTVPAAEEALISLDEDSGVGGGTRVVISPLVDLRGRLVDQADVEAFTVRSTERSYWRLTALDTFDGSVWTSRANYSTAEGALPAEVESGNSTELVRQAFVITGLDAVWLPTAFQPVSVSTESEVELSWEPVSSTLIVGSGRRSSNELAYTVESAVPRFTPEQLAEAPNLTSEELEPFLELPRDFSAGATALATQLTDGLTSPYAQALALQFYFRDNFDYDVEVGSGHSSDRIDDFLASGRGYCEQFAGSFAAMARAIGLPTRVAVGFTPGDVDPADPTLFTVRGEHAHAWPEVFISGAGWVAFEPTPGRGAPGAFEYTQVPEQQDTSGPSTTPTTLEPGLEDQFPAIDPDNPLTQQEAIDRAPLDDLAAGQAGGGGPSPFVWFLVSVVGVVLVAMAAVSTVKRLRRRQRIARVSGNRATILAAWEDAVARLAVVGSRWDPTETPMEFATRVEKALSFGGSVQRLAHTATAALFSPGQPSDAMVTAATAAADQVAAYVRERSTALDRLREEVDPRPLLGSGQRASRVSGL